LRQRFLINSAAVALFALAVLTVPAARALADGGPIMPLSEVKAGMDCTGETVVQGTTISSFNVHVIDVVRAANQGPRILVSVSGPAVDQTGVAAGMSGSPVYCLDASGTLRNAGAISQGIGQYGNNVALVTPIEQMLGEPVKPPSSAPRLTAKARSLLGPFTVGGLSPSLLGVLQQAGRDAGRSVIAAPPSLGVADFPVQDLVPGASVGAAYSTGTIASGAVGTVTYRDGSTVYAFGHELDGAGRRSLLLEDAYVYYVVSNPDPSASYKLAFPGHPLGTLTSDTQAAVIGELGALPSLIPVQVTAHDLDTGRVISEQTQVADETAVGLPLGSSLLDTIAPLAVGQAAIDIYNGPPASESGRMCLRVLIRESSQPLGFCNRYVGTGAPGDAGLSPPVVSAGAATDVGTAFGVLDQVRFAALHVTKVQATIEAQRGLAEASIAGAQARSLVKAGGTVPVQLRVRVFRGGARTVSFRLRIPRSARGPLLVTIHGPAFSPSSSGFGGGAGGLASLLGSGLGGGAPPGSPPPSIAVVRKAIQAIGHYDGLSASFDGGKPAHAYSDPGLLISGRATLSFMARR